MSDETLDWLGNYFVYRNLQKKMTFAEFVKMYENGVMAQ